MCEEVGLPRGRTQQLHCGDQDQNEQFAQQRPRILPRGRPEVPKGNLPLHVYQKQQLFQPKSEVDNNCCLGLKSCFYNCVDMVLPYEIIYY